MQKLFQFYKCILLELDVIISQMSKRRIKGPADSYNKIGKIAVYLYFSGLPGFLRG